MKNRKMMHAYANSEREAAVESDNPHALIAVMYDELLRELLHNHKIHYHKIGLEHFEDPI